MPKSIIDGDLPHPEELLRVQELNDKDRIELILQKSQDMIRKLVWFVISSVEQYPQVQVTVTQINRLLSEINMHYANSDCEGFNDDEKQLFDELLTLDSGDPAEFMNTLLPLFLSLQAKSSKEYKHMTGLTPDIQTQLFLISANAQLLAFLRLRDHDTLLDLGVLAASLNKIVLENQELYIEEFTAITQLSNELEMYLTENILKSPEIFDIEKANALLKQTRDLLKDCGFSVQ
jgi:hypothetical protein